MERCPLCDQLYEGHKGIFIDEESSTLIVDGEVIKLTRRLFQVLAGILSCDPRLASVGYLMDYVYGAETDDEPGNKIISVMVCKARKKIKHTRFGIVTIWGHGFKIVETDDGTGK